MASDWRPLARRLVGELRASGALTCDRVAEAMEEVPRHAFIAGHYAGPTPGRVVVDPAEPNSALLDLAYANRGIMTHTPGDAAGGHSSASQPAIVARMLELAELASGMRVLEIGAGTGYNSALIAHLTQAPVWTVEASPVVADEARAALGRVGEQGGRVRVVTGDGYLGHPDGGPYDRILVTCGIAGIPPGWIGRLAPGGFVLAPIAHGGMHPLVRVTPGEGGAAQGRLVASADFMNAGGRLYEGKQPSPATRELPFPEPVSSWPVVPALESRAEYIDLWMYLAGLDPRVTCAYTRGGIAGCALVVEDETAAVLVQPDGVHLSGGGPLLTDATELVLAHIGVWRAEGRPGLGRWRCDLVAGGGALLTPNRWEFADA